MSASTVYEWPIEDDFFRPIPGNDKYNDAMIEQ